MPGATRRPVRHLFVSGLIFSAACGGGPDGALSTAIDAVGADATLHFNADWSLTVDGPLQAGRRLRFDYAIERSACRASSRGAPAFSVTGHYRWDDGEGGSVHVAGHSPDPSNANPGLLLDRSGKLELWFESTSVAGCQGWDSNFGNNYVFEIAPAPSQRAPGWMGNVSYAFERQTCQGRICAGRWRDLQAGFLYETWARQRAALRQIGFQVWAPGVTDFDNPDLWRQLDVQVHHRYVGDADFTSTYVNFDERWGNDAHYVVDLRALDPFEWPRGAGLQTRADCPSYTVRPDATGHYAEVEIELYFTVNGVELRAADGAPFRGRYQDYVGNWSVCF